MSYSLPVIDLTNASVGSTGTISLKNVGLPSTEDYGTLQVFNESGCGLNLRTIAEGHEMSCPAGAWRNIQVKPGESGIAYSVIYVISGAKVNSLISIYYFPGENVDMIGTLGNSPLGGSVSSISTLSNEGNAAGTIVIDIGPATPGQVISIWNDHFTWSVVQGSTAHQVLKGQTVGNPLQIGQSGDISEVLGNLNVDNLFNVVTSSGNTISINGSTSGTATMWQDCTGIIKRTLIFWNNFRNGGASNQDIALPQAYVNGAFLRTGELANFQLLSAGVAQTISTITALAAGGGSNSDATSMSAYGIGTIKVGFDTIRFPSGQLNPHTGFISIDGH